MGHGCLERLRRDPSAGPFPLEVISAEPAGDVYGFAHNIKTAHGFGFHCFQRKLSGVDPGDDYLGLGEAFGAVEDRSRVPKPRFSVYNDL